MRLFLKSDCHTENSSVLGKSDAKDRRKKKGILGRIGIAKTEGKYSTAYTRG